MFKQVKRPDDQLMLQLTPILQEANRMLREEYQDYVDGSEFNIEKKQDDSPVTQADLRVNAYITQQLQQLEPFYPLISEEGQFEDRHSWSSCWLLDPLDGTKEFINKRAQFTINLSLVEAGRTVFSVIAVPCESRIYMGYIDSLPWRYDTAHNEWYRYEHMVLPEIETVHLGLSHRSKNPKYQKFAEIIEQQYVVERKEAGSAYKFCMMLEQKIDIYPRFHPTSEWDTSAGQGLLESIGGGLVDLKGRAFLYNQRHTLLNGGFIAYTNPELGKLAMHTLAKLEQDLNAKPQ